MGFFSDTPSFRDYIWSCVELFSETFNIRWCRAIWKSPITAHPTLSSNVEYSNKSTMAPLFSWLKVYVSDTYKGLYGEVFSYVHFGGKGCLCGRVMVLFTINQHFHLIEKVMSEHSCGNVVTPSYSGARIIISLPSTIELTTKCIQGSQCNGKHNTFQCSYS